MKGFAWLLGLSFVACLFLAGVLALFLSPLLIGLLVQGEDASPLWALGLIVSLPVAISVMVYVAVLADERV